MFPGSTEAEGWDFNEGREGKGSILIRYMFGSKRKSGRKRFLIREKLTCVPEFGFAPFRHLGSIIVVRHLGFGMLHFV